MTGENAGGRADNSPNERERSRVLCSDHSGRVTEPASCATCKLENRLTKLVRENAGLRGEVNTLREQVRGLENALEAYEQQLAHLEDQIDGDEPTVVIDAPEDDG